ncbi:MAG TPA: hypothetical protein PLH56_06745 [Candidatus Omnitrophota bacterium]|nr:hypothetical protein [Candidatus Omnitrophota bacterium]HPN89017.1 hypothetical protein [Candidatus Omnitrophota bacterium]
MKKKGQRIFFVFIAFLLFCGFNFPERQDFSREEIRREFKLAKDDPQKVERLVKLVELLDLENGKIDAVVLSYYGALRGLQAKYAGNPVIKLSHLKACLLWLDKAVEKRRDDLEVRFVRFSTIHHLPPLLGIPKRRGEDIAFICDELVKRDFSLVDVLTQQEMVVFMLKSHRLNREQIERLKRVELE